MREEGWYRTDKRRPHHRLRVWQSAKELALEIYRITARFPDSELYGLTSQLRRAAVSVPSNIAEGSARSSDGDFLRFLSMSRGSLNEIDTQLEIAEELEFLAAMDTTDLRRHFDDTSARLQGLIRRLQEE
jgi:four helix bundle protein